ncbi:MAG: DCC1-like thiol-disulfide oxidoreductase family protein [Candidatus Obscuribacterales bacterium]|nr:DCC1-like thiol-disulfide oxidoreductase family protein [Candidatus Obscuribacterales bacterium]
MNFSHILLYDGRCALCNTVVSFVLPRDRKGKFAFASLQSKFAHNLLSKHQRDADELNTFYCVENYGTTSEKLLSRASGGLFVLSQLGGIYSLVNVLRIFPLPLLNAGYRVIARNRYKWFGRYDTCRMPEPQWHGRFLDFTEEVEADDIPIS